MMYHLPGGRSFYRASVAGPSDTPPEYEESTRCQLCTLNKADNCQECPHMGPDEDPRDDDEREERS